MSNQVHRFCKEKHVQPLSRLKNLIAHSQIVISLAASGFVDGTIRKSASCIQCHRCSITEPKVELGSLVRSVGDRQETSIALSNIEVDIWDASAVHSVFGCCVGQKLRVGRSDGAFDVLRSSSSTIEFGCMSSRIIFGFD